MKLETERLILRKPRMSDANDFVEGRNNLKIIRNFAHSVYPYEKKNAQNWIKYSIKDWNKKEQTRYAFVIELKKEKKIIGVTDLYDLEKEQGHVKSGSWLNEKYWRKGYLTESKIAINNFVFNKLKLRRMETDCFKSNINSKKMIFMLGYKLEGEKRKSAYCGATNKIHNEYIFGLLKEDWKKNLPKLKKHLKEKIRKLEK